MGLRRFLRPLNDPNSVTNGVVTTALTAALALVDPRRLTPGRRLAYRGSVAALAGWVVWIGLRPRDPAEDEIGPIGRAALTTGAAGAVLGMSEATEQLDARMHDGLARAGASRPRLWLAAGEALVAFGAWWAGRSGDRALERWETAYSASFEPLEQGAVEIPSGIRALAERLLGQGETQGAPQLRAQLAAAELLRYVDGSELASGPCQPPTAEFSIPETLPLAVPGTAVFPVIGRFRGIDGRTFDVRLHIERGRLDVLSITEGDDWSEAELEDWIDAGRSPGDLREWPEPEALQLFVETEGGYAPVTQEA